MLKYRIIRFCNGKLALQAYKPKRKLFFSFTIKEKIIGYLSMGYSLYSIKYPENIDNYCLFNTIDALYSRFYPLLTYDIVLDDVTDPDP